MSEHTTTAWCLTHDKPVTNRFVAAVCPNDVGCRVVPHRTDRQSTEKHFGERLRHLSSRDRNQEEYDRG